MIMREFNGKVIDRLAVKNSCQMLMQLGIMEEFKSHINSSQELHRNENTMVVHNHGKTLYTRLRDEVEDHLDNKVWLFPYILYILFLMVYRLSNK
jgi:hypothetical protein